MNRTYHTLQIITKSTLLLILELFKNSIRHKHDRRHLQNNRKKKHTIRDVKYDYCNGVSYKRSLLTISFTLRNIPFKLGSGMFISQRPDSRVLSQLLKTVNFLININEQ